MYLSPPPKDTAVFVYLYNKLHLGQLLCIAIIPVSTALCTALKIGLETFSYKVTH